MSLINDMLRDLEQRRGGQPVHGYDALKGVSPAASTTSAPSLAARSLLLGLCAGLVIAAVLWVLYERHARDEALTRTSPGPERAQPATPLPAPETGSTATVNEVADAVPMVAPAPVESVQDEPAMQSTASPQPTAPAPRDIAAVTASSTPPPSPPASAISVDETPPPTAQTATVTRRGSIERQQSLAPPPPADRLAAILARLRDSSDTGVRTDLATFVAAHPHMAAARAAYARELLRIGDQEHAQATLTEGLALDRTNGTLAHLLAHLLVARGDVGAALAVLEAGIPSAAESGEYLALAAALYQREGRHAAAVDAYREALADVPGRGAWWVGLAISLDALEDGEGANRAYQRALVDRDLSDRLRAWANRELGRLEARG